MSLNHTVNKAHFTFSFLRQNHQRWPVKLKETSCINLVWSTLEYTATIPDLSEDTPSAQMSLSRTCALCKNMTTAGSPVLPTKSNGAWTAPWSQNGYGWMGTSMLHDFGWEHLADGRRELCLVLLCEVIHDQIAVLAESLNLTKQFKQLCAMQKFKLKSLVLITTELKMSLSTLSGTIC